MLTLLSIAQEVALNSFSISFIILGFRQKSPAIPEYRWLFHCVIRLDFDRIPVVESKVSHSDNFITRIQTLHFGLITINAVYSYNFATCNQLAVLFDSDVHNLLVIDILDKVHGHNNRVRTGFEYNPDRRGHVWPKILVLGKSNFDIKGPRQTVNSLADEGDFRLKLFIEFGDFDDRFVTLLDVGHIRFRDRCLDLEFRSINDT